MFLPLGDAPSEPGPRPWVNHGLVAANVGIWLAGVFLLRGATDEFAWTQAWGLVPAAPRLETFFTHMFLHGGPLHVGANMLMLWVFGAGVERRLGHLGYLLTYLACGLAAALFFVWLNPDSTVPMVGASGAIFGVAGFYFVAFPRNRVLVLFWMVFVFTFWVPARLLIGIMFVTDLVNMIHEHGGAGRGGTAFAAHVGGFLGGAALAVALRALGPRAERVEASAVDEEQAKEAIREARRRIESGQVEEARRILGDLLRDSPYSREAPEAALLLGHILSRIEGRPEAALELLKFAARLHGDPRGRREALDEIRRIRGGA